MVDTPKIYYGESRFVSRNSVGKLPFLRILLSCGGLWQDYSVLFHLNFGEPPAPKPFPVAARNI
jgi:hypothetical protein